MSRPTPNRLSHAIASALVPGFLIAASRARLQYSGDQAASVEQPCQPAQGMPRSGGATGRDAETERDNSSLGNRRFCNYDYLLTDSETDRAGGFAGWEA